MKLDLSPWARKDLDPIVAEILAGMEPRRGMVHIGRSRRDWRGVVTYNGWVIADIRGPDPTTVAERLITVVSPVTKFSDPPDGMTEAKARDDLLDGVAHFEWHGHDIEVEVS